VFLVQLVARGHRNRQVAVLAVVGHHPQVGENLPAGRAHADAVCLGNLAGDVIPLVAGAARAAEFRPIARRAVAGPAALVLAAGRGDPGGHVVPGVAPVGVILCLAHAPEPLVRVRQEVVSHGQFLAVVVLRHVVLYPVDEVVRRLVDVVTRLQGLLGACFLDEYVEVVEDTLRRVTLTGHHVFGGQFLATLRKCLEVVDRAAQVAAVGLGNLL